MLGLISSYGANVKTEKAPEGMHKAGRSGDWNIVNDGVMGGISRSRAVITDEKTLLFTGTVSLENNGGFASIRHDARFFGIGGGDGIRLRVKGDGKTYQLRVRTSDPFDGIAYKADFVAVKGEWKDLRFPWERFQAIYRGRIIDDAPKLDGGQIRQVGFLIAEKQAGPFELEVDSMGSFRQASTSR